MRARRYETGSEGKFASRWRAKSPDALCAVLPSYFSLRFGSGITMFPPEQCGVRLVLPTQKFCHIPRLSPKSTVSHHCQCPRRRAACTAGLLRLMQSAIARTHGISDTCSGAFFFLKNPNMLVHTFPTGSYFFAWYSAHANKPPPRSVATPRTGRCK